MGDVVVIGSGVGGGTVACRLVDAGYTVTLLERGRARRWPQLRPPLSFEEIRHASPAGVRTHRPTSGGYWAAEVHAARSFLAVSALGGGADAFTGALVPPPRIWTDRLPEVWREQVLERLPRALAFLGAKPLHSTDHRSILAEATRHAKLADPAQEVYHCASRDDPGGNTLNVIASHLDRRVESGGLRLQVGSRVVALQAVQKGYRVHVSDSFTGHCTALDASTVVLAAGALVTPRLLLEARYTHLTLPRLPLVAGMSVGANAERLSLMWDAMRLDGAGVRGAFTGLFAQEGGSAAVFSPHHLLPRGPFHGLRQSLLLLEMSEDASLEYRRCGQEFRLVRSRLESAPGSDLARRLDAWYQAQRIESDMRFFGRPISVHPTGGMSVGTRESDGAVDARGQVVGLPGLYVADASLFPTSPGVPPALTVAALAECVSAGLISGG